MRAARIKRGRFEIVEQLLDRRCYDEWVRREGRTVYLRHRRALRVGWVFGRSRARSRAFHEARRALRPGSMFARSLERRLDQIASLVREIARGTVERKYKDLFTVGDDRGLVVVPRGSVRNELTRFLLKAFDNFPALSSLPGLAPRVLEPLSLEAELIFFERVGTHRGLLVDGDGAGGVLGADGDFAWGIGDTDGHYYYAYTLREDEDLRERGSERRFEAEIKEFRLAQEVHLKRLSSYERALVKESYEIGDVASKILRRSRHQDRNTGFRPYPDVEVKVLKRHT